METYAEMILEGFLCQQCGTMIDQEEVGHARLCQDCELDSDRVLKEFRNKKIDSAGKHESI